jgi:hypothetical protein
MSTDLLRCVRSRLAFTGGSTMSAPTSARGGNAEMLRTPPIRRLLPEAVIGRTKIPQRSSLY